MFQGARKRMMQQVPSASVVITNPTHYAVALRFKPPEDRAPVMVAKGVDHLAMRIKKIAYENDIVIVENAPLARQLYKEVDIDQMIPESFFNAVANVFVYVQRVNEERERMQKGF